MSLSKAAQAARPVWKTQLEEASKLMGQGGKLAYKRATLLAAIYEDRDFLADCGMSDPHRAAEELNKYTEDLSLSFLELRQLLRHFPNETQWAEGKLRSMYAEMTAALLAQRKAHEAETAPRTVNRVSRTQLDEVIQQKNDADYRVKLVSQDNQALKQENEALRAKVAELQLENARLQGRVEELERIATNELQAA